MGLFGDHFENVQKETKVKKKIYISKRFSVTIKWRLDKNEALLHLWELGSRKALEKKMNSLLGSKLQDKTVAAFFWSFLCFVFFLD